MRNCTLNLDGSKQTLTFSDGKLYLTISLRKLLFHFEQQYLSDDKELCKAFRKIKNTLKPFLNTEITTTNFKAKVVRKQRKIANVYTTFSEITNITIDFFTILYLFFHKINIETTAFTSENELKQYIDECRSYGDDEKANIYKIFNEFKYIFHSNYPETTKKSLN